MKRFCSLSVAVLAAAVLSACGGGGSEDAGSTTSYATQAAWTNLYAGGNHAWALSGTTTYQPTSGSNTSYPTTATLVLNPAADAAFPANGVNAHVLQSTTTVTLAGSTDSSTNNWYLDANLLYMGSVDSDGYCEVATQSALPQAYARIGNGGTLANVNLYESCSAGAALVGSGTLNWGLELKNNQAYFCLTSQLGYVSGGSYTEKDCVAIDVNGAIGNAAYLQATDVSTSGVASLNLSTN